MAGIATTRWARLRETVQRREKMKDEGRRPRRDSEEAVWSKEEEQRATEVRASEPIALELGRYLFDAFH